MIYTFVLPDQDANSLSTDLIQGPYLISLVISQCIYLLCCANACDLSHGCIVFVDVDINFATLVELNGRTIRNLVPAHSGTRSTYFPHKWP